MNTSTEHILQCNQSEPLADASGRIVDLMNENDSSSDCHGLNLESCVWRAVCMEGYIVQYFWTAWKHSVTAQHLIMLL